MTNFTGSRKELAACFGLPVSIMRTSCGLAAHPVMVDFPVLPDFPDSLGVHLNSSTHQLKVGMDLVQISRIQASVDKFGVRFMQRIFTEQEAAYACNTPVLQSERLAARFAAKEATMKALGLADKGVAWRDMEVFRLHDGSCELRLHGLAAEYAKSHGVEQTALSLSHDGDYAAAIVVAVVRGTVAASRNDLS